MSAARAFALAAGARQPLARSFMCNKGMSLVAQSPRRHRGPAAAAAAAEGRRHFGSARSGAGFSGFQVGLRWRGRF